LTCAFTLRAGSFVCLKIAVTGGVGRGSGRKRSLRGQKGGEGGGSERV